MFLYKKIYILSALWICEVYTAVTDIEYGQMPPLFHLDDWDSCMTLKERALYCNIEIQLLPVDPKNYSNEWRIIQDVTSNEKNFRHDRLRHGICVPEFCPNGTNNDTNLQIAVSNCYTNKYKDIGIKGVVTKIHCETAEPFYSVDLYDIIIAFLFAILISIVVFASFYEGLARYRTTEQYDAITETKFGRIIACFSLPKNWTRLGSKSSHPDATSLKSINGVRFFNMVTVIMAHSCMIANAGPVTNPQFTEKVTENPFNMLLVNGGFAIQSYLVISGWLLSYHFFLTFEGRKNVKIWYIFIAFVNRYIRLTPSLLVVMAFSSSWLYHINRGPLWDKFVGEEYRNCRNNWWANLLYINNYYDTKHVCMLQSWYLATDTQLFLLSLVITMIMWKYQRHIKPILATTLAIGILIPGIINYVYNYDIIIRHYPEPLYTALVDVEQWHTIHITAHTNIGGYTIGLIFGYIFYKCRNERKFTKKFHVAIWWILTWTLPLGIILLAFPFYEGYGYTRIGAAVYVALARNIFALGIAIGMFGFTQGIGWFLRDACNWSPLQVLGRLTYSVYLSHVALIRARGGQARSLYYLSSSLLMIQTFGDLVMAYICGALLCLFVEMPISALQKLFVPQLEEKRVSKSNYVTNKENKFNDNLKNNQESHV